MSVLLNVFLAVVGRYLERRGWASDPALSDDDVAVYVSALRDDDGEPVRLLVPRADDLPDAVQMCERLIDALAALERTSREAIIESVAASVRASG